MDTNPASPLNQARMLRIALRAGIITHGQARRRAEGIARRMVCEPTGAHVYRWIAS
jgi:hypothetical protein